MRGVVFGVWNIIGHASGDVTDIYEQTEITRYLSEDGAKLESYVRTEERQTLKLEGRKA